MISIRRSARILCCVAWLVPAAAAQPAPEPDWTALAKQVVSALVAQHYAEVEERYDGAMKAALPAGKIGAIWDGLRLQAGALQEFTPVEATTVQSTYHRVVLRCQFEKMVLDATLSFDADQRLAGLFLTPHATAAPWSPPDYAHAASYHERAVTVGDAPWKLPGTLTLPTVQGLVPAVVLVHGSGPEDEDETIGPNKPFKDLAVGLASRGIAVLRYVKRTAIYRAAPDAPGSAFTTEQETVADALAAIRLARHQPEIDPSRVVVLGHSLGGTLAPRIAQRDPQIAGIILLAGSARPLEKVIVEQLSYLASLQPSAQASAAVAEAEKAAREIESPELKPTDQVKVLGTTIPGSYFLDLRSYHPAATAAELKIPILVLQGSRDYQVTLDDFKIWKTALADDPRATFKLYPGLFHLFMPSATPGSGLGSDKDYEQAGHVALPVIEDIAHWLTTNFLDH